MSFSEISSTPSFTPYGLVRPDFSRNERDICSLNYKTYYGPLSGTYPIGFSDGEIYAGYLFPTVTIAIELEPYQWIDDGIYLLEHDCTVTVALEAWRTQFYGQEVFFPDESVEIISPEPMVSRITASEKLIRGSIIAEDPIMSDEMGSIILWSDVHNPDILLATATLNLRCISHFLPTPGY